MTWSRRITVLALTAGISSCGVFGADDGKSESSILPAGGGATGTGGSGASPASCAGLPGPAMVEVSAPIGVKYCIDRTEVTQQQYKKFLAEVATKPGSEHTDCSANATYQPEQNPSSKEGSDCHIGSSWTPDETPNRPMQCIDWCDAVAYCVWAGKRLCGKIGGGRLMAASGFDLSSNPAFDPEQSQWHNACTQGGKTIYPYGDTYDPLACEGRDAAKDGDGGVLPKKDVAARTGCRGSRAPFDTISDMSGSVWEMTDECLVWNGQVECAARGGGRSTVDKLSCRSWSVQSTAQSMDGLGFRCCKDLP